MLLDTHVLLWYASADVRLSNRLRNLIESQSFQVSIISFWEIAIKLNIGKLNLDVPFLELLTLLAVSEVDILEIEIRDTQAYINLPLVPNHRDPFDRMLAVQAMNRSLPLVSADAKFDFYAVRRVWQ